jgi:hypothetical protein
MKRLNESSTKKKGEGYTRRGISVAAVINIGADELALRPGT